ncbi:MAG: hypothetical protein ABID64_00955, partial [Nitrospirota bacterium]
MPALTQELLQLLVKENRITREQADEISLESINSGDQIEALLLKKDAVNEEDLLRARATLNNIPYVTLSSVAFSPELINYIPEAVARKHTVLPFEFDKTTNTLSVAMADPLDAQVIDFLEKKTDKSIQSYM